MRKTLFLICLLAGLYSQNAYSLNDPLYRVPTLFPEKQKGFDPSRLTYGGNFGLQFGNITSINLSPLVGYRITDNFIAGVGVTYIYYSFRTPNYSYKTSLYGGRLFSRYYILESVFLHGELELLNFEYYDPIFLEKSRYWYTTPMIGAGYSSNGRLGGFTATALYAFGSENPKSPYYGNPWVFQIGFFL